MPTNKNFYSLLDKPTPQASPSGDKIYEWSYLDKVGNLKSDQKNVYEEIQSFKNSVDYKKKIEQGETFENGNGIYMDTTKFNGDYGDLNEYLARLASDIRSQVASQNSNGSTNTGDGTTNTGTRTGTTATTGTSETRLDDGQSLLSNQGTSESGSVARNSNDNQGRIGK